MDTRRSFDRLGMRLVNITAEGLRNQTKGRARLTFFWDLHSILDVIDLQIEIRGEEQINTCRLGNLVAFHGINTNTTHKRETATLYSGCMLMHMEFVLLFCILEKQLGLLKDAQHLRLSTNDFILIYILMYMKSVLWYCLFVP